jgi:hypothetical protein
LRLIALTAVFSAVGIPLVTALGAAEDRVAPAPPAGLDCPAGDRIVTLQVTWDPATPGAATPGEAAQAFMQKELPSVAATADQSPAPSTSSAGEASVPFNYERGDQLLAVVGVEQFDSGWLGTIYDTCFSRVPPVERSAR